MTAHSPIAPHRRAGFTILEVLLAMSIFAIGFVAVSSMFPAAAILQKQTVDDMVSQQVARSAQALLQGSPFTLIELGGQPPQVNAVNALQGAAANKWKAGDRSFPSNIPNARDRRFYWVPLAMRRGDSPTESATDPAKWSIYAFILKRDADTSYAGTGEYANADDDTRIPRVQRIGVGGISGDSTFVLSNLTNAGHIRPGDYILDSNGVVYTVKFADATTVTVSGRIVKNPNPPSFIWFAPPPPTQLTLPSPAKRIVIISDAVKKN